MGASIPSPDYNQYKTVVICKNRFANGIRICDSAKEIDHISQGPAKVESGLERGPAPSKSGPRGPSVLNLYLESDIYRLHSSSGERAARRFYRVPLLKTSHLGKCTQNPKMD